MQTIISEYSLSTQQKQVAAQLSEHGLLDNLANYYARISVDNELDFVSSEQFDLQLLTQRFLQLQDIVPACELIMRTISHAQRIAVYGDFDTDGVSATCIIVHILQAMGADVVIYPIAVQQRRGMVPAVIDFVLEQNVAVLIAVDCASEDIDIIRDLNRRGCRVIVADHHECKSSFANLGLRINPKQPGCPSGLEYLCGAGVAYALGCVLVQDWLKSHPEDAPVQYKMLSDLSVLCAAGTIVDYVPLVGTNQYIISHSLHTLFENSLPFVQMLREHYPIKLGTSLADRLGWLRSYLLRVIPSLLSVEATDEIINWIRAKDHATAKRVFVKFERLYKISQQRIFDAKSSVNKIHDGMFAYFLFDKTYQAQSGLIAQRHLWNCKQGATVAYAIENNRYRMSIRAPRNINVLEVLSKLARVDAKLHYGGHQQACGVVLETDDIVAWFKYFDLQLDKLVPVVNLREYKVEAIDPDIGDAEVFYDQISQHIYGRSQVGISFFGRYRILAIDKLVLNNQPFALATPPKVSIYLLRNQKNKQTFWASSARAFNLHVGVSCYLSGNFSIRYVPNSNKSVKVIAHLDKRWEANSFAFKRTNSRAAS